ncbi:MAG TPA: phosphate uptake regulator PhoU [Thermoplasmata archaeon]|nr:phosphate uptake regulator PhoU [Thermoplasmata archaeon]
MESRKLQLAGGSTYLVSLPKRWVLGAGLKAGDTVFLETSRDGSVSIRPNVRDRVEVRRKIFDVHEEDNRDHLLRKLVGAYVGGFGLIEIRFPPANASFIRRVAREFCRLVIGPEVIEETKTSLVIQDLSDATDLVVDKCLRRMQLTVRAMLEDSVSALRNGDQQLAHDVELRGQDVNRLYWMIAKQYHFTQAYPFHNGSNGHNASNGSTAAVTGYLLIARHLERIGRHARRIAANCRALSGEKPLDSKVLKEIDDARQSLVSLLDMAFGALVTRNIVLANEAIDARGNHEKLIETLTHRVAGKRGEELLALANVVDSLGRAAVYTSEIAEQGIDIAVMTEPEPT